MQITINDGYNRPTVRPTYRSTDGPTGLLYPPQTFFEGVNKVFRLFINTYLNDNNISNSKDTVQGFLCDFLHRIKVCVQPDINTSGTLNQNKQNEAFYCHLTPTQLFYMYDSRYCCVNKHISCDLEYLTLNAAKIKSYLHVVDHLQARNQDPGLGKT